MNRIVRMFMPNRVFLSALRREGLRMGVGCDICKDVNFGSEPYLIQLGDRVRVTAGVKFVTHDGGMWTLRKMGWLEDADRFGEIRVGDNTHIGFDCIIMPGVHIGENCVIGCGAVVTHDIPPGSVAVGVPARVIQTIEEYYEKNKGRCVKTKSLSPKEKKVYLLKNRLTGQKDKQEIKK